MPKGTTTKGPNPEAYEDATAEYLDSKGNPIENPVENVIDTAKEEAVKTLSTTGTNFSEQELALIEQTKNGIDFSSSEALVTYGSDISSGIAAMTEKVLGHEGKLGELKGIGNEIGSVVVSLTVGEATGQKKGILARAKRWAKKEQVKRLTPAEAISKLEEIIETSEGKVESYIPELEELRDNNMEYMRGLAIKVAAGKQAIEKEKAELEKMRQQYMEDGVLDNREQVDLSMRQSNIDQFINRVNDLERMGVQAVVNVTQICAIKDAAVATKQKMVQLQESAIPVVQMQTAVSVMANDVNEINQTGKAITDVVQSVLEESVKQTHALAVSSATESQRPVIEDKTLKTMIDTLTKTVNEVNKITEEGRKKWEQGTQEYNEKALQLLRHGTNQGSKK